MQFASFEDIAVRLVEYDSKLVARVFFAPADTSMQAAHEAPGVTILQKLPWSSSLTGVQHAAVQAVKQHHAKELSAAQELHALLDCPGHPELHKAAQAIKCKQTELQQQRDVFIKCVTRLLKVSHHMNPSDA